MKKLLSIILSITMLLSMATVAFADDTFVSSGAREVEGIIKVGVNAEFPPFEYMENDKLLGFDIDLMNYIAARIGYGVEFVNMPFDKLIPSVISGEVDCAISGITITEQRAEVVDFTRPYLEAKVTYNGEESIEKYGIVFPLNSINKARLIEASGDPFHSKYMLVDNAILSLKKDGTILKLIEKYELNSGFNNDEGNNTTYSSIVTIEDTQTSGRPADGVLEENMEAEIPRYETWEEIGLTNPLPSEWAAKDVDFARAFGILEEGKEYNFLKPITREEFCELIYNYCDNVLEMLSTTDGKKFTDTDNPKIEILSAMGIINGKTASEFVPNDALTREEAAVILQRMVNATVPVSVTEMWFEFDDIDYISDWAMDAVQTMCNMNVMNGVGGNEFAPKEVYTTEQAIVTITRVYSAQTAQFREDIGNEEPVGTIIGGADAPTQITVIDTKKVDDFYIDEATKLIKESAELASDKEFIGYYTGSEEMTNKVLELGAADYSKPSEIYYMSANREQIINNIKAFSDEELDGFDIEKLLKLNKVDFAVIGNMINASYGAENLAALTILTNSRGYIMPKDFADDFALYFEYDEGCSALVSFSKFGDDVIKATMQFVVNGDKDNIFSRLYEITQGLGEDSIDVAIVK